jgi:hypothetical protein
MVHAETKSTLESEEPESRRPTPPPTFDMREFARDSESQIRATQTLRSAADEPSTGPPPPHHPASILPKARVDGTAPETALRPSAADALKHSVADCVHRAQLLRSLLRVGGVSRVEGARALREELRELGAMAALAGNGGMEAVSNALRLAIEELGGVADETESGRDVLAWVGTDVALRDTIAVSAETQGMHVRVASESREFWAKLVDRRPDIVIVRADVTGFNPKELCTLAREAMGGEKAPIILLVEDATGTLTSLEEATSADRCLHSDVSIEGLTAELVALLSLRE